LPLILSGAVPARQPEACCSARHFCTMRSGDSAMTWGVLSALTVMLALFCFPPSTEAQPQAPPECKPTVVGKLETFELPSKVFDFTRTIRVFLPPGYNDPANRERHYPVL